MKYHFMFETVYSCDIWTPTYDVKRKETQVTPITEWITGQEYPRRGGKNFTSEFRLVKALGNGEECIAVERALWYGDYVAGYLYYTYSPLNEKWERMAVEHAAKSKA